ncbi:unnamed protein product [Pseudo-nitzschia multistriata]|uniref:Uncharacterized protein n=1 Tax=Pseudo-nitzschia multistriata TaxID=183589 RepID=A0A448YV73_9STRA|nr:unnamed protein product [Pseudo-nitzschia multistriata]
MSEYAALHATSLLLVGKNCKTSESSAATSRQVTASAAAVTTITSRSAHGDTVFTTSDLFPDDEQDFGFKQPSAKNFRKSAANDNGIETIMQLSSNNSNATHQSNDVLVLPADDLSDGPDESRWRSHGITRRRKLLEEDKRIGGRDFSMSFDCSVQRYFSVAHWALEQFHQLYQKSSSSSTDSAKELEELYLMGHRVVAFLTECLPRHPGFARSPFVRQRCKQELDHLMKCLEDVAIRIDEQVCNQFVDDGDFFLDSMLAAEMANEDEDQEQRKSPRRFRTPSKAKQNNSAFAEWEVDFPDDEFGPLKGEATKCVSFKADFERTTAESPTAETVGTNGTESLEPSDTSYTNFDSSDNSKGSEEALSRSGSEVTDRGGSCDGSNDYRPARDDDQQDVFDSIEFSPEDEGALDLPSQPVSILKGVRLDFLKTIACEPVLYETDSEAADSWANTADDAKSRPCLPSSSGVTPTCDPARIAFRDLMNKLPHKSILQRNNQSKLLGGFLSRTPLNPPDRSPASSPTLIEILGERNTNKPAGVAHTDFDDVIENEIKEYLDSSQDEEDPKQFVESCHAKMSTQSKSMDMGTIRHRKPRDDRSSVSSYVSSSSSSTVASTTSSQSLKSLTNKTGSQTSAFSSFGAHRKEQQMQGSEASKTIFEQDDWISFDNSSGDSFFADSSF